MFIAFRIRSNARLHIFPYSAPGLRETGFLAFLMPAPAENGARISATARRVPVRYRLVLLLFALTAVAYLDRTNLSIAGVSIRKEFAIDNTQLGWLISAFLIGYAAFQVPAGLLARRFGARRALTTAVLLWAIFSALTALVPRGVPEVWLALIVIRFLLGGAEAMLFPASSQFVERWFPERERGRANGIIFAGVGAGSGMTPPLVTEIILHCGWRAAFWFSALVEVAIAAVWYLAARDAPENTHRFARRSSNLSGRERSGRHEHGSRAQCSLGKNIRQQGGVGSHGELLRLWLCSVALLCLALYLSSAGERSESQDQCSLLDGAFYRDDRGLSLRRRAQ